MDRGGGAPGGGDDIVAGLTRWLAEQRADAAVASRAREAWLRRAAEEDATVIGVLLDLAERASVVAATGVGARTHRGTIRAVGDDVVVLRTVAGDVVLRVDALTSIRADGPPPVGGDRPAALALAFAEAVAAIAGDRPRIVAVGRDGHRVAGELRSVGRDVATLGRDDGETVFVPLDALAEVRITA